MVDFNNEVTITTPAKSVEQISILQRRYDLIDAYEDFKKKKLQGSSVTLYIVRARLISFYFQIHTLLDGRIDPTEYSNLRKKVFNSDNENEIVEIIEKFNRVLYNDIKLTKIDTRKVYDAKNWEEENKIQGF